MSDHQGLKGEIEARSKSISACVDLGKTLVLNRSPASEEVSLTQGPLQGRQVGPLLVGGREDSPDLAPGVLGGFSTQGLIWLPRLIKSVCQRFSSHPSLHAGFNLHEETL